MDPDRTATAVVGLAIAVLGLVVAPYAIADPGAVGVYYRVGPAGPPLVGLFAVVSAIAAAAGARGRSDPATAAGVALSLAAAAAAVAGAWALAVTPALVGGFTTVDLFEHHRWALVVACLGLLAAAAGGARGAT